jgi:CRISPR system Cascade subunit CasB
MSNNMLFSLKPETEAMEAFHDWWNELKDRRGDRAGLRRAKSTLEVVLQPAFMNLMRSLEEQQGTRINSDLQIQRLALIAGVLSGVEQESDNTMAQLMAKPRSGGDMPRVSALRFRRLLVIQDPEELLISWKRTLRLLDNKANIQDLVYRLIWWNDRTRREMALEYYRQAPAAAA